MAIIRCFIFRLGCKTGCIFQKFLHPAACKWLINGYKSAFFGVQIFAPRLYGFLRYGAQERISAAMWRYVEPRQLLSEFCGMLENVGGFRRNLRNPLTHSRTHHNAPELSESKYLPYISEGLSCLSSRALQALPALLSARTAPSTPPNNSREVSSPRYPPELPTNRRGRYPDPQTERDYLPS